VVVADLAFLLYDGGIGNVFNSDQVIAENVPKKPQIFMMGITFIFTRYSTNSEFVS
jgi:hypothetical protein